jgi:hypothetical protein
MSKRIVALFVGLVTVIVINVGLLTALIRVPGRDAQGQQPPNLQQGAQGALPGAGPALDYTPVRPPLRAVSTVALSGASVAQSALPTPQADYVEIPADVESAPAPNNAPSDSGGNAGSSSGASINSDNVAARWPRDTPMSGSPMLQADIAVEADYEFDSQLFGGDLVKATNYVSDLMKAVSAIYERDIRVRLNVTFIRIATTPDEPWTATTPYSALLQLKDNWLANGPGVSHAAVLFLSGKNFGGGVSFRAGLCNKTFNFAVVGSLKGVYGTSPGGDTWDLVAVAHELGHTFGSKHSHCTRRVNEPNAYYDECYNQQQWDGCYTGPVQATNGTIMSYCYLAGFSMTRIDPISFSDGDPAMTRLMRYTAEQALVSGGNGCLVYAEGDAMLPIRR